MALSEALLSSELLALSATQYDNEADAINALLDAYGNYLLGDPLGLTAMGAEAGGIFLTVAGVNAAKLAAAPTLAGMAAPGPVDPGLGVPIYSLALTKIPQAISQGSASFWGAIAASFAVSFPGSIAMTAPPHANLPNDFEPLMIANTTLERTASEVADEVAALLHSEATTGGTITVPGPTIFPII